jgi:uncharacterized protein
MKSIVAAIQDQIKSQFEGDSSGHDWHHFMRVVNMSKHLQKTEGGDLEIIELAALLHDISDHKFNGGKLDEGGKVALKILLDLGYDEVKAEQVKYIVDNVSYKGANTPSEINTLEGKIVQDADRIDAIGAIGIGRTFAYGGNKNQAMYIPELEAKLHNTFEEYANEKTSTINHFHEKLLLLSDRLNTKTAKEIGRKRHQFMEDFLTQFYAEWNFQPENN